MTRRIGLGLAAAAALATGLLAASPAVASPTHPDIVGGTRAPATPWAVQLEASGGSIPSGYVSNCTGEQLNSSWVLTAQHCVDGIGAMDVYHSNSTSNRGTPSAADAVYVAPAGDIALVHLASAYSLASYPALNLSYSPQSTGSGTILGYGLRANQQQSDGLYQASVSLTGASTDAYGGTAQHLTGVSGASNHGDSGGPLIVSGSVVGVCSTGDSADPGADTHAGSNYAVLAQSASWIRSTAGV